MLQQPIEHCSPNHFQSIPSKHFLLILLIHTHIEAVIEEILAKQFASVGNGRAEPVQIVGELL
jgi:hypothetical protein